MLSARGPDGELRDVWRLVRYPARAIWRKCDSPPTRHHTWRSGREVPHLTDEDGLDPVYGESLLAALAEDQGQFPPKHLPMGSLPSWEDLPAVHAQSGALVPAERLGTFPLSADRPSYERLVVDLGHDEAVSFWHYLVRPEGETSLRVLESDSLASWRCERWAPWSVVLVSVRPWSVRVGVMGEADRAAGR